MKMRITISFFAVLLVMFWCGGPFLFAQEKVFKIGILQMVSDLDVAVEGFKAGMKNLGYIEGRNVVYEYVSANGVMENVLQHAEYFAASDKDLIFSCSTPVTKALKIATNKTKNPIPVVFTPVTDPVSAGIAVSLKSSGCNVTGVLSGVYTDKQLQILKEIIPRIKTVLVISKKGDGSSEAGLNAIIPVANRLHIDLIIERPVQAKDVIEIFSRHDFAKIDAIHIPPDTMVGKNVDKIFALTRKHKIPIIVHTHTMLPYGGFLSFTSDYFQLAKNQVAVQADKILRHKIHPRDIEIEEPKETYLGLNLLLADEYGIHIPSRYIDQATHKVKQLSDIKSP